MADRNNRQCSPTVTYLHVDSDLYDSARDIFYLLGNRLQPGSIIIFDELTNYPSYDKHEMKVLFEYVSSHPDFQLRVIGASTPMHMNPPHDIFYQSVAFIVVWLTEILTTNIHRLSKSLDPNTCITRKREINLFNLVSLCITYKYRCVKEREYRVLTEKNVIPVQKLMSPYPRLIFFGRMLVDDGQHRRLIECIISQCQEVRNVHKEIFKTSIDWFSITALLTLVSARRVNQTDPGIHSLPPLLWSNRLKRIRKKRKEKMFEWIGRIESNVSCVHCSSISSLFG